jgi:hypothetical protein
MPGPSLSSRTILAGILLALSLSACTPRFDWREVRGTDAPYIVLMPAKPSTQTRSVNIGGATVDMTMTAADVNGVTFAVGSAEFADAAQATAALGAMKSALVRNIGGTILHETTASAAPPPTTSVSIDAIGPDGARQQHLFARLVARERRVYQVLVVGAEKAIERESVDMFLDSFKPS